PLVSAPTLRRLIGLLIMSFDFGHEFLHGCRRDRRDIDHMNRHAPATLGACRQRSVVRQALLEALLAERAVGDLDIAARAGFDGHVAEVDQFGHFIGLGHDSLHWFEAPRSFAADEIYQWRLRTPLRYFRNSPKVRSSTFVAISKGYALTRDM